MRCRGENREFPASAFERDPVWGQVHKGARGWHTISGTDLEGEPPGLTTPAGPVSPRHPVNPERQPDAPGVPVPLNPPAPPFGR